MKLDYKESRFCLKAVEDDGTFGGYASVFGNVDKGGDIVMPGAFAESLEAHKAEGTRPAMLWQHDHREPIGVWEKMTEDQRGLRVEGRLLIADDPVARRAHAHLKAKSISGLSIGFETVRSEPEDGHRKLVQLNLWETSIVTFPMNIEARVDAVKSPSELIHNVRDYEAMLRDWGFSQRNARKLAAGGWEALGGPDELARAIEALSS